MISDGVIAALALALGLSLAWVIVGTLNASHRGFRRLTRWVKCKLGFHAPSGSYVPAVGGRNVERCLYCDDVVGEVKVTKDSIRRMR
jgi:hypothetical protein